MSDELERQLIKYRLDQARVALDDAKFLLGGKRSPQSIVNRSYYAMFYAALALLQTTGKVPHKHAGVISLFDTEFVLKGVFPREMSKDFHKAFELRQVSDYRVVETVSSEKAEALYHKAVQFVRSVQLHLAPSL